MTAIATGPSSRGVAVSCPGCLPFETGTIDLTNTIARGVETDLRASSGSSTKIVVESSNFETSKGTAESIVDKGGNQTTPPLFVDAANGDYREAAGSPTIDAGVTDPANGPLDLEGNPRTVGAATDIGAYEFVPPLPPAGAAGQIQSLRLSPARFRAVKAGEAILSAKKKKAPVGTTVTYSLSAAAQTEFFVEKKVVGRKVEGQVQEGDEGQPRQEEVRRLPADQDRVRALGRRRAPTASGSPAGSAEVGLRPGAYRLVGEAGGSRRKGELPDRPVDAGRR